jgi:hypothetical protein
MTEIHCPVTEENMKEIQRGSRELTDAELDRVTGGQFPILLTPFIGKGVTILDRTLPGVAGGISDLLNSL